MGGYGSGRSYWLGCKATTESQNRVDIRWLKKQGCLTPGKKGLLSWSHGDKLTSRIGYKMEATRMILLYQHRASGGNWELVEQIISFSWTPCNYGDFRTWFLCPGCGKRIAVLYGAGKYFLCRHCYNLAYSSQHEGKADWLRRKARKIRRQLGASENLFQPILFKPKNMHQKTFDRLRKEADHASYLSLLI